MESYALAYSFTTRGCDGAVFGGETITDIDGSSSSYTLSRLEENSDFDVSITAMNGAGNSPGSARISPTTLMAGGVCNIVR